MTPRPRKEPQTEAARKHELARLKLRNSAKKWDGVFQTIKELFRILPWLAAVVGSVFSVKFLAGHETKVDGILKLLVDLKADEGFALLFGGSATIAYIRERRRHQRTIAEAAQYQRGLELKIDPDRSSSNLLPSGQPRKEDRE